MFKSTSRNIPKWPRFWRSSSSYSTNSSRIKPTFRTLLGTPIFKSIFLTLVFGSTVIDLMKSRKELASLVDVHKSKFTILEEIINKLENGENVNIQEDLKLANALTKYKYNTTSDINIDEELEKFLKLADGEAPKEETDYKIDDTTGSESKSKATKKFI